MSEPTLRALALLVAAADDEVSLAQEALAEKVRVLKEAEGALQNAMTEQGIDIVRVPGLTLTMKPKWRPQVKDWETFYRFVIEEKAPHMFERRVSAKAFEEMLENRQGEAIPGVDVFEYTQLQKNRRG